MPFYSIGDTSKALCGECEAIVYTTLQLKGVPLSDNSKAEKDLLVSVCDCCGNICGLPQQSLSLVQDTIRKTKDSVEARVSVAIEQHWKHCLIENGLGQRKI